MFRLFVGGITVVLLAIVSIGCAIEPPDPAAATGSGVEGYVRDDTGRPIAGATIELLMQNGNPVSAEEPARHTDNDGYYRAGSPPASIVLVVRATGYESPVQAVVAIRVGAVTRQDFTLVSRLHNN